MEYKLRQINPSDYYEKLLYPYFNFYEQLNGKGTMSSILHRNFKKKAVLSEAYGFIDNNFEKALKTLINKKEGSDIRFIGAFDENEVLSSISRLRNVMEDGINYACIAEIIPLIMNNDRIKADVINAFEKALAKCEDVDYITFEVPPQDKEFQTILSNLDYQFTMPGSSFSTILFDKPLREEKRHR